VTVGLALCGGSLFLLSKVVLSRLANLQEDVRAAEADPTLITRVREVGSDEIAELAYRINTLLNATANSQLSLRASEEQFRILAELAPVGIWMTDASGATTYLNRQWAELAGIDAENQASIALHQKLGFQEVGHFKQVGYKFGRWLDLVFYQLLLEGPENPEDF
jgi:PAS domain-containing protein